jgi:hypothetical protein
MPRTTISTLFVALSALACKYEAEKNAPLPVTESGRSGTRTSPASDSPERFLIARVPIDEALIATLPDGADSTANDLLARFWTAIFGRLAPERILSRDLFISPDTRTYAYPARNKGRWFMVTNGQKGTEFDQVGIPQFLTGGSVAYEARKGNKSLLVVDASVKGEFDRIAMPMRMRISTSNGVSARLEPVTSGDGKIWSCIATRKGHEILVSVPGHESAEFDEIGRVVYASDGSAVAYPVRTGKRWSLVANNTRGPEYDEVAGVRFGPTGEVAYTSRQGKRWALVLKNKRGPEFDEIGEVAFGPGGRVAYSARVGKQYRAVEDEQQGGLFDEVHGLAFAPDGRLAYVARRGKETFVIVDGKAHGPYEGVVDPAFTQSSEIAFAAKMQGMWRMLLGESQGPVFDGIDRPRATETTFIGFAGLQERKRALWGEQDMAMLLTGRGFAYARMLSFAHGGDVAYVATQKADGGRKASLVVGNSVGAEFGAIWNISSEHRGLGAGYAAVEDGKWRVVMKGVVGPAFDAVHGLLIGPRGMPVYIAQQDRKWFVVAGDRRGAQYDDAWLYGFSADGTKVVYGALDGRDLWRKVMVIGQEGADRWRLQK